MNEISFERAFGGKTPLYYALFNDCDHLSKYIVANGGDNSESTSVNNENSLIFAAGSGKITIVRSFLR